MYALCSKDTHDLAISLIQGNVGICLHFGLLNRRKTTSVTEAKCAVLVARVKVWQIVSITIPGFDVKGSTHKAFVLSTSQKVCAVITWTGGGKAAILSAMSVGSRPLVSNLQHEIISLRPRLLVTVDRLSMTCTTPWKTGSMQRTAGRIGQLLPAHRVMSLLSLHIPVQFCHGNKG